MSQFSILCSLFEVMLQPSSVKVRRNWPFSSSTSIHICLAHTPGSDALSGTKGNTLQWQQTSEKGSKKTTSYLHHIAILKKTPLNDFLQYIVNAYKHLGSFCFSRNGTVCFWMLTECICFQTAELEALLSYEKKDLCSNSITNCFRRCSSPRAPLEAHAVTIRWNNQEQK